MSAIALRLTVAALVAAAVMAAIVLHGPAPAAAEPTASQKLFEKTLLDDAKTSAAVKALLGDGGGFVAPDIAFADVTGDERSDALVLVETGGAAGAVAFYVLSTHGKDKDSALSVIFRSQRLYRAGVRPQQGGLMLSTPKYGRGDDLCCPGKVLERVYTYSDAADTLRRRSMREIDGPDG